MNAAIANLEMTLQMFAENERINRCKGTHEDDERADVLAKQAEEIRQALAKLLWPHPPAATEPVRTMRAKLEVSEIESYETHEVLKFKAVGKCGSYPEDGSDEDNTYATWTPSATLEMRITNPALRGRFMTGQKFYVDFTPADVASAEQAAPETTGQA